jgi:hypothetical protein
MKANSHAEFRHAQKAPATTVKTYPSTIISISNGPRNTHFQEGRNPTNWWSWWWW